MTEPSLLCVSCGAAPPPHRRTWYRCIICVERDLPSTYYCGEECMNAHWPKHQVYHREQEERAKMDRAGPDHDRSLAEAEARRAERTGDEYDKRFAAALALNAEGDLHAAAKAWRKLIKERPHEPVPCYNLATVLVRSGHYAEAAQMYLKTMELEEEGTKDWADSAASAFGLLKLRECREAPKPEWWNDEALKALSAQVVALSSDRHMPCAMRARVLCGDALIKAPWNVGPRTAAEVKEAASWFRRAAMVALIPADKLPYERAARVCDVYAGPLLAEEKAEAAEAHAAAAAEEAEARKVAEVKAAAAAEELLAEDENEKHQASTKAGKATPKGKKGKGRR